MVEDVTMVECFSRFADEWVCLEVLEEDEAGQTQRGRVVAHSRDKDRVLGAERAFRGGLDIRKTLFFAGPLVDERTDVVIMV